MTRDEAIAAIEESRSTHVAWIEHLEAGCVECEPKVALPGGAGPIDHHLYCVGKYDGVLEVLRAC